VSTNISAHTDTPDASTFPAATGLLAAARYVYRWHGPHHGALCRIVQAARPAAVCRRRPPSRESVGVRFDADGATATVPRASLRDAGVAQERACA
jgi:hypothetical protein